MKVKARHIHAVGLWLVLFALWLMLSGHYVPLLLTIGALSCALIVWIAALSIAVDAPFIVFLIFVPLINLSVMVPLTINGIGLRESLFYLLFSQIGVPVEMAVSLSLVNFLIYVLTAIPGGIIYSLYKKEEHLDEILVEAEQS